MAFLYGAYAAYPAYGYGYGLAYGYGCGLRSYGYYGLAGRYLY